MFKIRERKINECIYCWKRGIVEIGKLKKIIKFKKSINCIFVCSVGHEFAGVVRLNEFNEIERIKDLREKGKMLFLDLNEKMLNKTI
jgi:hypothetical protein